MKNALPVIMILLLISACKEPEARRPIQGQTDRFIEESVIRNRQLLAREEDRIRQVIIKDSTYDFQQSGSGFWYAFEERSELPSEAIEANDAVTLSYVLATLDKDTIYTADDIGVLQVQVDKEALFPGLREGIKMLRKGDKATFLFPSAMAYGYPGDQDRIGTNLPLRCSVTIINVEKSNDRIQ